MSVWIDETSAYGTFPLESMKCGVPVLGKVPNLIPEWLTEDNGIWISEKNAIVDVASDFIQNWLEDNLNIEMFFNMEKTAEKYSNVSEFEKTVCDLFSDHQVKRAEIFENQLKKLQNN
jgi:glycosyltransferase involved in cell wall biosynthesis